MEKQSNNYKATSELRGQGREVAFDTVRGKESFFTPESLSVIKKVVLLYPPQIQTLPDSTTTRKLFLLSQVYTGNYEIRS